MNNRLDSGLLVINEQIPWCITNNGVGGPSVGKTALMKMILLKAISLGLNGMLTTLMSE
jgi:hypothetical protein